MTVLLDGDNIRHGLNKNLGFRWDSVKAVAVALEDACQSQRVASMCELLALPCLAFSRHGLPADCSGKHSRHT